MSSNEYLTRVNLMHAADDNFDTPIVRGKNVAVIGGGNTAMDSVRTARLWCKTCHDYLSPFEEEMPARLEEVQHAKEEGVEFMTLHNPIEYIGDEKGHVVAMVLQKCSWASPMLREDAVRCLSKELSKQFPLTKLLLVWEFRPIRWCRVH